MTTLDSEEALEQAAMALLNDLAWESVNCYDETLGGPLPLKQRWWAATKEPHLA